MITMVFCDERHSILQILTDIFEGEDGVEIVHEPPGTFVRRSDLDALLLNEWLAHDIFGVEPLPIARDPHTGARASVGEAHVARAHRDHPGPAWVVTPPRFAVRFAEVDARGAIEVEETFEENGETYIVTPPPKVEMDDSSLTVERQTYLIFTKVLRALEQLNEMAGIEPRIQRLGCDLEALYMPVGETDEAMQRDIAAIRDAVRDNRTHRAGT